MLTRLADTGVATRRRVWRAKFVGAALALTAACAGSTAEPERTAPTTPELTLVALGDSHTTPVGTGTDGDWLAWADPDGRFRLLANAGVGGERSDQIFARVETDVIAHHPTWATVLAGTNDIGQGVGAEPIIFNLTRIYDALATAEIGFIAITIPPLVMLTPEKVATHRAVNAWIRERVPVDWPNGVVGDWSAAVSTNGDGISPAAGMFPDGVHFSAAGAQAGGQALAPVLAAIGS